MSRSNLLALFASALAAGCAHTPAPPVATAAPVAPTPPRPSVRDVGGVWEWTFRSNDGQGDLRVEQEEWHLEQHGKELGGFYDRAVTILSTDERLFRCNQKMGFTKFTRVRVGGLIDGDKVVLRELSYQAQSGPCDDGARSLVQYIGKAQNGALKLQWAPDGGQTLHKRDVTSGPALAQLVGVDPATLREQAGSPGGPSASVPVDGAWEWDQKTVDADGDERIEDEVWELTETPDGIAGHYDLDVKMVRGEGTFACNRADHYETRTRFEVHGQRVGDRISLLETGYHIDPTVEGAKKGCDNGRRRLDTYQGTVSSDGEDLILSWGPGYQLLRRKH